MSPRSEPQSLLELCDEQRRKELQNKDKIWKLENKAFIRQNFRIIPPFYMQVVVTITKAVNSNNNIENKKNIIWICCRCYELFEEKKRIKQNCEVTEADSNNFATLACLEKYLGGLA